MQVASYRCVLHKLRAQTTNDPYSLSKNIFLYIHLHYKPLLAPPTGKEEGAQGQAVSSISTAFHKCVRYGEQKWHEASLSPSGTLKHRVYKFGSWLMHRIPVREWMLWRAYSLAKAHQGKHLNYPLVIHSTGNVERAQWNKALAAQMTRAARHNKVWSYVNTALLVPVTILTILPGFKLVWAWVAFRAIARHRASIGATWIKETISDSEDRVKELLPGRAEDGGPAAQPEPVEECESELIKEHEFITEQARSQKTY